MGKTGYKAVKAFFRASRIDFGCVEDRADYVTFSLQNLRFIYKFPDQTVSQGCFRGMPLALKPIAIQSKRESFRSPLIIKAFSKHLQRVNDPDPNNKTYGLQVGALALAAAAVCARFCYSPQVQANSSFRLSVGLQSSRQGKMPLRRRRRRRTVKCGRAVAMNLQKPFGVARPATWSHL